ncbi:hypothetical protein ANRL1_02462 [Anaerolineae bacterium]|nr:hypothetical protein ANRL1_02462 [Anaerolineae bacterium]
MTVGSGRFTYALDQSWGPSPDSGEWKNVVGIAVNSLDQVFVLSRAETPVRIFDQRGHLMTSWGEGVFTRPHGIHIGLDDSVYCADDKAHVVLKFTSDGHLVKTWGTPGVPSDTGYNGKDRSTIKRGGLPFNRPTNSAVSPSGELYVSDGYGNARVHKFDAKGNYLLSWGEPGEGPGQFRVVHGVQVDRQGRVLVSDRENGRIQIFSPDGVFLAQWGDLDRPEEVDIDAEDNVYVAEGFGRVSIFTLDGTLLARWGKDDGTQALAEEELHKIHALAIDSQGSIFVASQDYRELGFVKKFARLSS